MAALGALLAWFLVLAVVIAAYPLSLAAVVIGLLAWGAYARWTPPEPVEAPESRRQRPQRPVYSPPDPEPLFLAENLPGSDDPVSVYIENVKRAHRIGGRKPKPAKRKPLVWNPARVKTEAVASRPVDPESVPATHPMRVWVEQAGLPWPPS
jgi:hypothetical protein